MGPSLESLVFACGNQRHRPACAHAQAGLHLYFSLVRKYYYLTCYNYNGTILASLGG